MTCATSPADGARRWRPLLGLAVLALAACASSGGLQPHVRMFAADRLQAGQTLGNAGLSRPGWPASDWWRALGDPALDVLIAEGLQHNPGLEAADARLRQARAQIGAARAERLPGLSASAGYNQVRLPASMVGEEFGGHFSGSLDAYLHFSYGVDLWGGKRAAWEAAVDSGHAAEVDARAARLDLSAAIVSAYAQLGYAWQLQDVAGEELARAQKTLDLTRQRRRAGIDSDLQVRQAEARIPAAQQQRQAARQQIDEARTALAALLGQGPDRGLLVARPRVLSPLALQLPGVLPSDLLGRRPDIVAARWRVEAAARQIHVAKARFYPSLNLTALGGVVSSEITRLLNSGSTFALLGPALSLPIFDGGRLRANLDQSDAQYDLAVAGYNQSLVDALREVADQVSAVGSLGAQAQAQARAVATAQAAHDLAQLRYRAGVGSYLDVLEVEAQLLEARQRQVALQSQQVLASVRLSQALGGGFPAARSAATAIASPYPRERP
ncbi:efflux transporter outer membrane subunit [Stenotrophomonas sp. YIM B06876]|uniref:efflux transporter outer membrane subunit n=1 Tax=Stenotrophomonas sp. YIM B06876 TaxID=3060211 RepID=UPI00273837D4|nr:efflux transporter outer membrane subunit [Stenotrophomonas sp. YIM B06876]